MALPRFMPSNANLVGMFRTLGPSLLRIGGNSVDKALWAASGAGQVAGQVAPPDVDALAGFSRACGWSVLYGVNLATSTPVLAAQEVAYAAKVLGSSLYGIEIGNEPDLYGGNYFQGWTLQAFEARWQQFRDAIARAVPGIVITGPADAGNIARWTVPFAQYATGQQIALLTQHYYRGSGQSPSATAAALITPDAALATDLAALSSAAAQVGVPFRLAETNSYYGGGAPGVSNSYASALWVIDQLFTIALGGGVGVNLHGGGNGAGYTPIADSNGTVVEARPEYYGLLLFTLAGQGKLLGTTFNFAGENNASAYAVQRADGSLSLVVVNKDVSHTIGLTIDCGRNVNSATLMAMTASSLTATSGVQIQGAGVGVDGSFAPLAPYRLATSGSRVNCYVAPLSAALIHVI